MSDYSKKVKNGFKTLFSSIVLKSGKRSKKLAKHVKGQSKDKPLAKKKKNVRQQVIGNVAWTARLATKGLDALFLPETLDAFWQLVKANTRGLTDIEVQEARKVFGDTLPYYQIRIDEKSAIARLGALFAGSKHMGVSTFHTINFTKEIKPQPGNADMAWLIHELVHVAQMINVGSQYTLEALHAQFTKGYKYGGPKGLKDKSFSDFNREQQGDIIQHYYYYVLHNRRHPRFGKLPVKLYKRMAQELKEGKL